MHFKTTMAPDQTGLETENQQLRQQVRQLIQNAERNEHSLKTFQRHQINLMSAENLVDFFHHVIEGTRRAFELEQVTLLLLDQDRLVQERLSESLPDDPMRERILFGFPTNSQLSRKLYLGRYEGSEHQDFFPRRAPIKVAIVPLVLDGYYIGSLNLGSHDLRRFEQDYATDYINHLGAIVAHCFRNVVIHGEMTHHALTDPLTGLYNRRYFEQRLQEELRRLPREKQSLTCAFLDVDKFKSVNDLYGHDIGDEVLNEVAQRIKSQLRGCDVLARIGGEEFTVLLPNTGLEAGHQIAERIRLLIVATPSSRSRDRDITVSVSIGLSCYQYHEQQPIDAETGPRLLQQADQAMFCAKQEGRNRTILHQGI